MPFLGSAHGAVSYGRARRGASWVNGGVVTTLAGNGSASFADGTGTNASFNSPWGLAVLPNNNIVVGDSGNNRIRIVTYPGGVVTTLAGGSFGDNDGTGTAAGFKAPQRVAVLQDGNIAVVDYLNNSIRIVTYPGGVVSTLTGTIGVAYWNAVAVLSNGNLIVTDGSQPHIRLVTYPGGVTTVLAGNFTSGFADGTGTSAIFQGPSGIAVLLDGKIVVADGSRIRIITTSTYAANSGVVTTLAGSGTYAWVDGTGTGASFSGARGVAVLSNGNIIVTERSNPRVRLVTYPGGVVTTIAGSGTPTFANGTGSDASFGNLYGVGVLSNSTIVVADVGGRIRLIT